MSGAALSKHTSKALRVVRPKVMTALQSPQLQRLASKRTKSIIEIMQSLFSMSSKSENSSSIPVHDITLLSVIMFPPKRSILVLCGSVGQFVGLMRNLVLTVILKFYAITSVDCRQHVIVI